MHEHPELKSARDRSAAANPRARSSLTLKEEPSNSMVDFVMHAETNGKGRDREKRDETKAGIQRELFRAPRRSASSDGEARCSSVHTISITGLASDDHRRNQQKSSCICKSTVAR